MIVKLKNTSHHPLPKYETSQSAGMDLRAFLPEQPIILKPFERTLVKTGLFMELPAGYQFFASSACAVFGIGIGGGGALWQVIRSFSFGSEIIGKTPEPNLPALRLALYLAVGLIAADRLLRLSPRRLTQEEIAERRRKAREKAREKSGDDKESQNNHPASGNKPHTDSNSSEA